MPWLCIEVLIFFVFILTMFLCLLKRTCGYKISADNSKMFEPRFLTFMTNRLCEAFINYAEEKFPHGFYSERQILKNKFHTIEPYMGINIRMKLSKESYYHMIQTMNEPDFDGKYVKERDAKKWMLRTLDGRITKEKLDK